MGLPDEQKGDREDKQTDESEDEQEDEPEDGREGKREETPENERKELREQLYEALSASDAKEKDYHVRQAIQLLQIEE